MLLLRSFPFLSMLAVLLVVVTLNMAIMSVHGFVAVVVLPHHYHYHRHHRTLSPSLSTTTTSHSMGLLEEAQVFLKNLSRRATASHILIRCSSDDKDCTAARQKLEQFKHEINNSPVKFAEYAAHYSDCPSRVAGGNLGSFGKGAMVQEFDSVVFGDDNKIGVVHGPVKTQFGYHLIFISQRDDD